MNPRSRTNREDGIFWDDECLGSVDPGLRRDDQARRNMSHATFFRYGGHGTYMNPGSRTNREDAIFQDDETIGSMDSRLCGDDEGRENMSSAYRFSTKRHRTYFPVPRQLDLSFFLHYTGRDVRKPKRKGSEGLRTWRISKRRRRLDCRGCFGARTRWRIDH